MTQENITTQIRKRSGEIVDFDKEKITNVISKAIEAVGKPNHALAQKLSDQVIIILNKKFHARSIPAVEEIQDIVEEILIKNREIKVAKAFILYRDQMARLREMKSMINSDELMEGYLKQTDWRVKENSNMSFSLQGLNNHISSAISSNYWLNKIYTANIRDAHKNGELHLHDLQLLAPYCAGWDLKDLLIKGFGGVAGKVEAKPAKHFRTALGQIINFFYTLQGEIAGAEAFANFDTLLAPFIRYDNLNYREVKQAMQEFLFNINVPTRVGFQCPFTNITMDVTPGLTVGEENIIIGGEIKNEKYKDFQQEMDMINLAFAELMMNGDAKARVFTFPIPTYNITKDFNWDSPVAIKVFEMTAKYGIPYFSNFVNSDMSPDDARSMCCRLRLDNRELKKRGGGLFAANPLTGSIGVVTINLPRIGYLSKTKEDFYNHLNNLMQVAYESLEIKREVLEDLTEKGLYPYARYYLSGIKDHFGKYWKNHFSTIGILGMNEALLNFAPIRETIATPAGKKFALEIMDYMRNKVLEYQEKSNNLFNLEATPAEGATRRFAQIDKNKFSDIIVANEEMVKNNKATPYYTNSTQLPVNFTQDIFEALDLQDELQRKYTGGCIEKGNKVLTNKGLLPIEYIVKNFKNLGSIKALSYNVKNKTSEWDIITNAIKIDVKKHDKIKVKGEKGLDIVTSDWHPFFVLQKIKPSTACPICKTETYTLKGFANHMRWNLICGEKYKEFPKYEIVEKRADNLKKGDYILQNSNNLYLEKKTKLDKDLMWLIGFFIGDGCISEFIDDRGGNKLKKYKVRFFSEHKEALNRVAKILKEKFGCDAVVIQNDKRSLKLKEISTSKKEALDFFFQYGFWSGEKSYNIFVPKKVKKELNKENVLSILGGLMDSDGHIDKRDGNFEYYTVSEKLAEDILEIFSIAGFMINKSIKKTKRKNEVNIWRLKIPQYELSKIKNNLENSFNLCRIKNNLSNRKKRHLPIVRVKTVSKVNVEDNQFYDLTTKNNHNYLAGGNTLVFIHNTVLHGFVGEAMPSAEAVKNLVKKIVAKYHLPYFTITPTFSICPKHGYLSGEHFFCPKCDEEIGYITKKEAKQKVEQILS